MNEERLKIQKEAFQALKEVDFNGGIILPTGAGKTLVLIKSLQDLDADYKVLYCCDNRKLRDEDFLKELYHWGGGYMDENITRMCYQAAYKLKDQYYDVLLMDEGDYAMTPEYSKLLKNNKFKHIIFASATLEEEKRKMLEEYIPIVYEKQVKEIEDGNVINKANLYFVNYILSKAENHKYLSYNEVFKRILGVNFGAAAPYDRAKLDAVTRNRKMFLGGLDSSKEACQKLMAQLYKDKSNKILIFCTLSEQADRVCKYSYHTKNQKDNPFLSMFDTGKLRILSVVGKIDRGVNLDGVNCVIFEAPGESKTKMTQKSGRARRLDIDSVSSFYFLVPFYRDRRGQVKPTIVQKWVMNATKDFHQNFKVINL